MSALQREICAAERIPSVAHVAHGRATAFGDYVQVIRLGGASFESSDDDSSTTGTSASTCCGGISRVRMSHCGLTSFAIAPESTRCRRLDRGARVSSPIACTVNIAASRERDTDGQRVYLAIVYRPDGGHGARVVSQALVARTTR